jgi:cytoskeletal protein CcmA (bactofilin family)
MSLSMRSLVSHKATNKNVKNNTIMAKFLYPPIYNGDLLVISDLIVRGRTSLRNLFITGNLDISGNIDLSGNFTADGDIDVSGNMTMVGDYDLSGNLSMVGDYDLSGNLSTVGNLDVSGNITCRNTIVASKFVAGQVINMAIKSYSELGQSGTTNIAADVTTDLFTYSYTPKNATSFLIIEYQTEYKLNGGTNDDIEAFVYVDGVSYGESWQWWLNAAGGGTRSSVMFPIVARYTNTNTTAKSIVVKVYNHTDADTVTVSGNTSTWLKITEIGR